MCAGAFEKARNLEESRAFRRFRRNGSAPIDSFDQQRQLSRRQVQRALNDRRPNEAPPPESRTPRTARRPPKTEHPRPPRAPRARPGPEKARAQCRASPKDARHARRAPPRRRRKQRSDARGARRRAPPVALSPDCAPARSAAPGPRRYDVLLLRRLCPRFIGPEGFPLMMFVVF